MKILIVVNYYYPYVSGVSEYAKQVAVALSSYHDVTVLTARHESALDEIEVINENLKIVRAKPNFFLNKGYISLEFFRLFLKLQEENEIINFHFPMLEVGLLSRLTQKTIWLTYQCDMALVGGFWDRLAVRAVQFSGAVAIRRASKVIVLSKDYAASSRFVNKVNDCKLVEISPPNKFESNVLPIEKSTKNKPKIGFVGRFVLEKGIHHIIDAAYHFPHVEFLLVGDFKHVAGGTVYNDLKDKIEKAPNIEMLGRLDDNELKDFYLDIDVLLLPSVNRFEAFGMVQLEAMEFGCLVVASDLPGVREVVKKTGNGYICDIASSNSLIDGIDYVLRERKSINRIDVRKKMRVVYSKDNFISSYLSLI